MAGDWIKFETVTPDKPEVYAMAGELGISPEAVVGHLLRVWIWADQQAVNCHALSVTFVTLNAIARRDGFAQAMQKVGWLDGEDMHLTLPHFDRHNGETAKKRGLAYNRKRKERAKSVTLSSRSDRDTCVTRDRDRDIPPKSPTGGLGADQDRREETPTNGKAVAQVRNARGPQQLSTVMRRLGLGDGPAGITWQETQTWAIQQLEARH